MKLFNAGKNGASFKVEMGSCLDWGSKFVRNTTNEKCKEMIYFPAAAIGDTGKAFEILEKEIMKGIKHRLLSFADVKLLPGAFEFWLNATDVFKEACLFLDSGAFSAFTRDAVIDLDEYIEYIKEHEEKLFCYSSLDVIDNPEGSKKNYKYMKSKGLNPLPVFHLGTDFKDLEEYCEKEEYIALGGMVPYTRRQDFLKRFLDTSWAIIKKYWPIKVHAFGVTSTWALTRYPFYSCDSTAAIVGGGMGRIVKFTGKGIVSRDWKSEGKKGNSGNLIDKDYSRHLTRRISNLRETRKFEKFLTDLWARRGISW